MMREGRSLFRSEESTCRRENHHGKRRIRIVLSDPQGVRTQTSIVLPDSETHRHHVHWHFFFRRNPIAGSDAWRGIRAVRIVPDFYKGKGGEIMGKLFYGIYEIGKNEVYVFMDETTYQRAYFNHRSEADRICAIMNANGNRRYEVREI